MRSRKLIFFELLALYNELKVTTYINQIPKPRKISKIAHLRHVPNIIITFLMPSPPYTLKFIIQKSVCLKFFHKITTCLTTVGKNRT